MKKRSFVFVGILAMSLVFGLVLVACTSAPKVGLKGITSYYVREDGNDGNSGVSEDAPFKTLSRAVQAASKTAVKKITVIGTVPGDQVIDTDPTLKQIVSMPVGTDADGKNRPERYATVQGSINDPDPEEILITGKIGAMGVERAVLQTEGGTLIVQNSTVRLENIEIVGSATANSIAVVMGVLTIAQGTVVTNNTYTAAIAANRGIIIMRDNATISGNTNGAVLLLNGSVLHMLDEASITNNKTTEGGGGIRMISSTTNLWDNAKISDNSADGAGGGIITYADTENGVIIPHISMGGNSSIMGNTAKYGGGIYLNTGDIFMEENSQITGNTATVAGGGVCHGGEAPAFPPVGKTETAILSGNTAPQSPDTNFLVTTFVVKK